MKTVVHYKSWSIQISKEGNKDRFTEREIQDAIDKNDIWIKEHHLCRPKDEKIYGEILSQPKELS